MTPQETVERTLALSRADECVVIADEESAANLRWAGNTLTTNGVARNRTLTVVAMAGGVAGAAAGVVSRSGVTPEQLERIVRDAERAADENAPAEDAAPLVVPPEAPTDAARWWEEPPAETSIGVFEGFAPALGETFERAGSEGRKLFGFAEHSVASTYVGTSSGLRLRHDQPSGTVEINAKSPDFSRSAWVGTATRDFTDVDVAGLDGELATRLGWARRRVDLPAGRYETILPPSAVADLMIFMYASAGARDAYDGRTVFSKPGGGTRVGESLTEVPLTLRSDPAAAGMECSPFEVARTSGGASSVFDNGLALQPTDWVRDGRLEALLQTRHSARLTGLPVTPGIGNLVLDQGGGGASLDEMVARTERGLLLTCLWYVRPVDPQTLLLTGLTRDGVYLVEGGEVVGAVNNFRFNESPVDLLSRVGEAGRTEQTLPREFSEGLPRVAMPPLRVGDFNMSTVSQAS